MIDHTQGGLSIVEQCKILGVNRSTWYYHGKDEREENVRLMDKIDEVHLEHPTLGSRTIRDHFRNNGRMVNRTSKAHGETASDRHLSQEAFFTARWTM